MRGQSRGWETTTGSALGTLNTGKPSSVLSFKPCATVLGLKLVLKSCKSIYMSNHQLPNQIPKSNHGPSELADGFRLASVLRHALGVSGKGGTPGVVGIPPTYKYCCWR